MFFSYWWLILHLGESGDEFDFMTFVTYETPYCQQHRIVLFSRQENDVTKNDRLRLIDRDIGDNCGPIEPLILMLFRPWNPIRDPFPHKRGPFFIEKGHRQ